FAPALVDDDVDGEIRDHRPDLPRARPQDDRGPLATAGARGADHVPEQRLASPRRELLAAAEPPAGARGEDRAGDEAHAARGTVGAPWMRPPRSRRRPAEASASAAWISATTASAISSGLSAPIARPIGACRRARSPAASGSPAASRS